MAIRSIAAASFGAALLCGAPAAAFDPFEIQIYDGTADPQGSPGLEIHLNQHHDRWRMTLEPSYGITSFWEVGGYFQTEDGEYAGVKLRTKIVAPERGHLRLGINFELSRLPVEGWGGEIRPIIAWEDERFIFAANPIVSFPASFEPAGMAKIKVGPVALGLEYYASVPHEQYLLAAADLIALKNVELNVAVGDGSARIAKMIVGYVF
jgi:hypothetical protein